MLTTEERRRRADGRARRMGEASDSLSVVSIGQLPKRFAQKVAESAEVPISLGVVNLIFQFGISSCAVTSESGRREGGDVHVAAG